MSYEAIQQTLNKIKETADGQSYTDIQRQVILLNQFGFTSCRNQKNLPSQPLQHEVERANISRIFGNAHIISHNEVNKLCKKYRLEHHKAARFKEEIPQKNVEEIIQFHESCRKNKWNLGYMENDLYHIPLTTEYFVIAPKEFFRKAQNWNEMSTKEKIKWKEEDPIVVKQVFRFDPKIGSSTITSFYIVVTAWGVEEMIINTN